MTYEFIATENVERFLGMLQKPHPQPDVPKTLQRLLVEEEDKLARNREQLEISGRRVEDGKERIKKLKLVIAQSNCDDRRRQLDLTLLATMNETQLLLEGFHRKLRDELHPFCIMLQNTNVGVCSAFDEARNRAQTFANANPGIVVMIIDRSNGDSHVVHPE